MSSPKRHRARILTASGLKKLRERIRSHEVEENTGFKYTLERLGELTGLDPETVKNVLDCKGSDKRTIARCFESFGLTLEDSDHISAAQVSAAPSSDPNFVGRDKAIADLNALVSRNTKVIVIQARGGVGKTTLARKYLQQEFGSFLEFPIAKETKDIASIEGLLEEKLRQLGEEPGREFLVSLDRLKRKLQAERIGILIDNLEPALDAAGRFIELHRRYVELLRALSDPIVKSITLITSRERLREADATVQHYGLKNLDLKAWEQFFQNRSINTETPTLAALHNAYGGNAKAMDIVSGAILEDFSNDIEVYWQANQDDLFIEQDLEDLVTKQFDRLQQMNLDAYNLLCRMGSYRYQDVLTIPIEGLLCLLWDVPGNRQKRVISSLKDRSLLEFENGEYCLHPVIRAEAMKRLRENEDWKTANQESAFFWLHILKSISCLTDILKILEAYYHYININDIEAAARVITKRIDSQSYGRSDLAYLCYRFGLINHLIYLMKPLVNELQPSYYLSEFYFLLGDFMWIKGKPNQAIRFNSEAGKLAHKYFETSLYGERTLPDTDIRVAFVYNNALYKRFMWELEEAEQEFKQARQVAEQINDQMILVSSYNNLALLNAYKRRGEIAQDFIKKVCEGLSMVERSTWRRGWIPVTLGHTYKELGQLQKAFETYVVAKQFAEESGYRLVEADCLIGLAEIHRKKQDFEAALDDHLRSINILDEIGSNSYLAEAHYQLGLTYQIISDIGKSHKHFQEATRLFNGMEAPKQVERVRRSMQ